MLEVVPDRYLFVLPGTFLADAHRYASEVLGEYDSTGEPLRNARGLTQPVVLPQVAYPDMLTFLDWEDVDSLRAVNPANLAETFGEGVEILSVTLDVTRDPVSAPRVAALLLWTCEPRRMDNGDTRAFRVPNNSPRGWYLVGSLDLGRRLNICGESAAQ